MKHIVPIMMLAFLLVTLAHPLESAMLSFDEASLYEQINEIRVNEGLSQMYISDLLSNVAKEHSSEMLASGFFDHLSPVDGSTAYSRVERSGYYDGYYGMRVVLENIGLTWPGVNVDMLIEAWMESPGHANNILSNYVNEIGIGIVVGAFNGREKTTLYTAVFAFKAGASSDNLTVTNINTETLTTSKLTTITSSLINPETTIKTHNATTSLESKTRLTSTLQPTTPTSITTLRSTQKSTSIFTTALTEIMQSFTSPQEFVKLRIVSNSTISSLVFDMNKRTINFTVNGLEGSRGFCNVSIPKSILDGSPLVFVEGNRIEADLQEDTTNYYVYFTYNHSIHRVVIGGSNTIPELSNIAIIFLLIVTIMSFLTTIYTKRIKRRGCSRDK
jgi:uncharacterized protein YkwD